MLTVFCPPHFKGMYCYYVSPVNMKVVELMSKNSRNSKEESYRNYLLIERETAERTY